MSQTTGSTEIRRGEMGPSGPARFVPVPALDGVAGDVGRVASWRFPFEVVARLQSNRDVLEVERQVLHPPALLAVLRACR